MYCLFKTTSLHAAKSVISKLDNEGVRSYVTKINFLASYQVLSQDIHICRLINHLLKFILGLSSPYFVVIALFLSHKMHSF